jgi:hypothetical protein
MKFADLKFDNLGCCGTHSWADARHANGYLTRVYDKSDGTYDVVTLAGPTVVQGQETLPDAAAVQDRLTHDAARRSVAAL